MKRIAILIFPALFVFVGCNENNDGAFHASAIIEGTSIKVSAQTGGYLTQVNFNEGDEVQAGQTIAVVDTEKLSYQLEQVQASLNELAAQRRIAQVNVKRSQDDFDYANTKHERFVDLLSKNAATQQMVDDTEIQRDRARTASETSKQNLVSLENKQISLQAQAKLLRRQISDALVTAPISGSITTLYFEAGETIPPNAPLAEIIDLAKMSAKVYVSETYLPMLRLGQSAVLQIDGTEQTLTGSVAWISSKAEFTPKNILTDESRTALVYAVKIKVDNPDRILKHGMPVSITLQPATTQVTPSSL